MVTLTIHLNDDADRAELARDTAMGALRQAGLSPFRVGVDSPEDHPPADNLEEMTTELASRIGDLKPGERLTIDRKPHDDVGFRITWERDPEQEATS